ncbi:MAG TPA: GspE/PulE family protein, partial [Longimicrobiales bacterium]
GESVVMRLLDRQRNDARLADIGLASDTLALLRKFIGRPHGMLLVTGPTGSGKTTTLYAALDALRTGHQKIITVEDPVEYELSGVTQVQVNAKIGLTFATALRAILRQDPDIVLVGEIRDPETAAIAVHAALTGHLVLATLHTNNAAGALTRMIDLGIAPYLLASTVDAVLAQRLVRRLCEECGKTDGAEPHARGCTTCRQTGYRGRTGVFELLAIDDRLRHVIAVNPDTNQIHAAAVEAGMRTLLRDGERLVAEGLTTLEEVLRVVRD